MIVPGSVNPLLLASAAAAGGLQVSRSLRFNSADSAYLSRTPASAGNRKTWTWAGWVKRCNPGNVDHIFNASGYALFYFYSDNTLIFDNGGAGSRLFTSQVFRDFSAWYHIVLTLDTTQATASNRNRLYVNGTEITTFSTAAYPTQNADYAINNNVAHQIGKWSSENASMYLADVFFCDGNAYDPSYFTTTDATTGQLIPKAFSGTYGTNGFHLDFADNSAATASTLGKDTSGNSPANNWTPNNLSVSTGGPTSVASASGALPIYNTTDTYGAVKGTGTRTDSNSSSIVLAVPMDGANSGTTFTDESATIKGSGAAKSVSRTNTVTSTSQSKFYGSSAYFNGSSSLSISSTSDFDFNAVDYTVEFWFYADASTISPHSRLFEFSSVVLAAYIYSDSSLYVKGGSAGASGDISFPAGSWKTNAWNHLAVVGLTTGERRAFLNGQLRSTTGGGNISGSQSLAINGDTGGSYRWTGYVSDFRVYKGIAKYSNSFNPPSSTQDTTIAAGNDSLVDVPTNGAQTDTGVGGEVRGNYAVLNNLLNTTGTYANGNLEKTFSDNKGAISTICPASGKWYAEFVFAAIGAQGAGAIVTNLLSASGVDGLGQTWQLGSDHRGYLYNAGSSTSVSSFTTNDVIGVAFDCGTGAASFYKNGTLLGTITNSAFANVPVGIGVTSGGAAGTTTFVANYGQRAFAYPVSGYKSLNSASLPNPQITKPSTVFDTLLWTGNGSARSITGLGFNPDLVWIKSRSAATDHELTDSVRGTTKSLSSNLTAAEATDTGGLTAFNSDGFSLGTDTKYNNNAATYAGWCWDAGSSTTTIAANAYSAGVPSITSSVRANATAGFSVVTYTGNGSSTGATVGHGLGVEPSFFIIKNRSASSDWVGYHKSVGSGYFLILNSTSAAVSSAMWDGAPSSTVLKLNDNSGGTFTETNTNGQNYVAYCFAPVVGYSSFGSYTGNGSSDGPFVYTGFRIRWLMVKGISSTENNNADWIIYDVARSPYNATDNRIWANLSSNEYASSGYAFDLLSNGFKPRSGDSNIGSNNSGNTYIYAAFSEVAFNFARAR